MDLKNRIQNLASNTTSSEVKDLCQKYLKESAGAGIDDNIELAESLFNDLKTAAAGDDLVSELLTEKDSYAVNTRKIEAKISQRAAQRLMENWSAPKKVSPVGEHKNNTIEEDNRKKVAAEKALYESLLAASKTDPSAGKVLNSLRIESYGISEAIESIKKSKIMSYPQLKYAIARFEKSLSENVSESMFVKDFLSNIAGFTWDQTVNEAYSKVKTKADSKSVEIEVQNAIYAIAESDKKRFFDRTIQQLNGWLSNDKRTIPGLVNEMRQWMFNPVVKNLVKYVQILENSHGNKFNVPVSSSNCSITKLYSPISIAKEGTIFRAGDTYYLSSKAGISPLSEKQVNGLPADYTALCECFFNPSVRVSDEGVHVHVGSTKVTINEDGTFIGESAVQSSELGHKLMVHTQKTMFRTDNTLIGVAVKLQENFGKIAEVDYGKAIFSNLYEGVGVYLFRKDNKIYINKINPSMKENTFNEANAVQTVNLVKSFLNYDLSESLVDMLDGDVKKKVLMEGEMNDVLKNIQIVESEIEKIENAIAENAAIADVEEVVTAKEMLEAELNKLKSDWHTKSAELEKFIKVNEDDDDDDEDDDNGPDDDDNGPDDDDNGPDDDGPEPEATEPEATEPEATEPEATEPEATEPEATEPEGTEPEATEPEATEPEGTEPEATEPEGTEPEVTEPEGTEPEVTEPEGTEPEGTEPEGTEPEGKPEGELEGTEGEPSNITVPDANVTAAVGVVDSGLAGAEGAQVHTQAIEGNDHPDANAGNVEGPAEQDQNVVDDGHAGASDRQTQAEAIPGAADVTAVVPTSASAEITLPNNIEAAAVSQQPDTSSEKPGDTAATTAGELPAEMPGDAPVAADGSMDEPTMNDTQDGDGEEKPYESVLNTFMIGKGLNEQERSAVIALSGQPAGRIVEGIHKNHPELMKKVMPFMKELASIAEKEDKKKIQLTATNEGEKRSTFVGVVNAAFSGNLSHIADRLVKAYDNLDESKPTRLFNMALNESVSGDITGRIAMNITHKAVEKIARYNNTTQFDDALAAISAVLSEGLDTNVKVQLVGSDKKGVVTACNSAEQTYTVLWDGGETGEYTQDQLEELTAEIKDNNHDNIDAAKDAVKKTENNGTNVTNEGFENRAAVGDVTNPGELMKVISEYISGAFGEDSIADKIERIEEEISQIYFNLSDGTVEHDSESLESIANMLGVESQYLAKELTAVIKDNWKLVTEKKTDAVTEGTTEDAGQEEEEEDDISVWTKAKVSIDFGPFKEGEMVDVDASQFVSSGDDDNVKLKTPKDEIGSIPKKYLKVEDGGENTTHTEVSDKLESALKNLEAAETLLQNDDKINKQEISDALGKVKAFKDALTKGK